MGAPGGRHDNTAHVGRRDQHHKDVGVSVGLDFGYSEYS
jgi:hypothetical protein